MYESILDPTVGAPDDAGTGSTNTAAAAQTEAAPPVQTVMR